MYVALQSRQAKLIRHAASNVLFAMGAMISVCFPPFGHAQVAPATKRPACTKPRISVEGPLSETWLAAVAQLCDALRDMTNVDPSAQLRVVPADGDVVVEATVGDGRVAVRRAHTPQDLQLTVEALAVLPASRPLTEPPLVASNVAQQPASRPIDSTTVPERPPPLESDSAARPDAAAHGLGVQVGGALVGRVARAPTYLSVGFELYGGLRPGDWLLGVTVRWDPNVIIAEPASPSGFEMGSVGAGFVIARRVLHEPVAFDAGLHAFLVAETQTWDSGKQETSDSEADVRVGLLGRLLFGDTGWRWAVSLEAELSPLRARRDLRVAPGLPTLPTWGLGLGLGAAWEEP